MRRLHQSPAALALLSFASLCGAHAAYSQGARAVVAPKRDALLQAAKLIQNQMEPFTGKNGTSTCDVDLRLKQVWVAALKVPGKSSNAGAGFQLPAFGVEGIAVPGAKVTATFSVIQVTESAVAEVVVINETTHTEVTGKNTIVSQPGTITLTTDAFTLQPGNKYRARATLWVSDSLIVLLGNHNVFACVGTIFTLQWVFGQT